MISVIRSTYIYIVLYLKPPVLKLNGKSPCPVPQVLLLLEPITNLNVPPLVKKECDIQFFV
jgi:hypothetical protein